MVKAKVRGGSLGHVVFQTSNCDCKLRELYVCMAMWKTVCTEQQTHAWLAVKPIMHEGHADITLI